MRADVKKAIAACLPCQSCKSRSGKPSGLLHPLRISTRKWTSWGIDWIVVLPITKRGYDSVLTVIDRCTKMIRLLPCSIQIDAQGTAELLLREVVRVHGLPSEIVSDRDPRLTSNFWTETCKVLGIHRMMSTTAHPQTDGQTERANAVAMQMVRCIVQDTNLRWPGVC